MATAAPCVVRARGWTPGLGPVSVVAVGLLSVCGLVQIAIGGYFIVARPALLPEDARFMRSTSAMLLAAAPDLGRWLKRVFWVLGGHIASTGVLTTYVANTGLRAGHRGALAVLVVAGAASVGWMALVNVLIHSNFKWPLVGLACVWALALALAAWTV